MKWTILAIVLYCSVSSAIAQNIESLAFGTGETLDVVTWNIERFPKNGETTIDYVIEIIDALDADLVALQEINDEQAFVAVDQALEAYQGYYSVDSRMAYLFKSDIIEFIDGFQIYETNSREFPREPLVLEFSYRGEFFVAINNHLKCCGDGNLNSIDEWDEETRRRDASELLHAYIQTNYPNERVLVLGDLNDMITDAPGDNAFEIFLDNPDEYIFADLAVAFSTSVNWSYPSWPSHLDHILITNELFSDFEKESTFVESIKVDNAFNGGFDEYDDEISDHRPVGMRIEIEDATTSIINADLNIINLEVAPNPFDENIRLQFDKLSAPGHLELRDMQGRLISYHTIRQGSTDFQINPEIDIPGSYVARLLMQGRVIGITRLLRK